MNIQYGDDIMIVELNKVVTVDYVGYFPENKEIFDSSKGEGREPITFLIGHQNMILGFEEEILGSKTGEKRIFTLDPERAYGHREEDRVLQMERGQFTDELEVGMQFQAEVQGMPMPFEVIEINELEVSCDVNHPMAGKALTFEVEILSIRNAEEEELTHGHVHGPGGHHH